MARWDEARHPRDRAGRFTDGGAGIAGTATIDGPRAARAAQITAAGSGARVRSSAAAMTDAQFDARAARVAQVIGQARKTHATELTHATTLPDGTVAWNPDRDRLHRQIAAELYTKNAAGVPREGRAVIAGGLGGAGKSTVLAKHAGVEQSQFVTLNPDDVKEIMADRGLIPDVPGAPDLSPMERAALVHEESSRITALMADMAYAERRNVIWDITMSSQNSVASRVDALKRNGYGDVEAVFVDIPVEVSVTRAMARYRRGVDDFLAGKGHGGRFVPPAIIRAQQTSGGRTANRETFDALRGSFNRSSVFDNSVDGRAPVRL